MCVYARVCVYLFVIQIVYMYVYVCVRARARAFVCLYARVFECGGGASYVIRDPLSAGSH